MNIEFGMLDLVWIPNFNLSWQYWVFESNLLKNSISSIKKIQHPHWIVHIRFSSSNDFLLKQVFLIILTGFCPKYFFPKLKKIDQHRQVFWRCQNHLWIMNIKISFCTKFQLKVTFWNIRTKSCLKCYFQSIKGKVSILIETCILNLVRRLNFSLFKYIQDFRRNFLKKSIK